MAKKDFLNLFLFIFVVILATIIYLSSEENLALETLTDTNRESINAITIRHNDSITSITRKDDNQWQITQPVNIAANNFRINTILNLLNAPVHNQYLLKDIDKRTTGLDDSQTTIRFNDQVIEFGIVNPVTNLRYVKLGNLVDTIEDVYYPLLTSHFGTLVSLNLLPANSTINKLVLPQLTLARDNNGVWQSDENINADRIAEIIDHWQHDQAFGIHDYMPRKQLGEISVYISGREQPLVFTISDTDPWLILARPDIKLEYHLEKEAYNNLIAP